MGAKAIDKNKKKSLISSVLKRRLVILFALLSLASFVVVQATPLLGDILGTDGRPTFLQLVLVGTAVILLSAAFLAYAARLIGFSASWIILGVGFTSVVVILKFIMAPEVLYGNTYRISGGFFPFKPNESAQYFLISLSLFLFYAGIFWLVYRYYRRKSEGARWALSKKLQRHWVGVVVTLCVLVLIAISGGVSTLLAGLVVAGPTIDYVSYLVNSGAAYLMLALVLFIYFAIRFVATAPHNTRPQGPKLSRTTAIAVTFWIGLSLLLMYHVLWIIYMTLMLSIWPFKVISPSGK
jgi:hypothetical protein